MSASEVPEELDLPAEVARREWYHTLELAPGVVTPGWFDTRSVVGQLPLPASLAGLRCLDVGTFEGFWAFEMERRGAAEVVAIDILDPRQWDWPYGSSQEVLATMARRKRSGDGFVLAARALGSGVARRELSVYDLDPAAIGRFDFVYLGSLLLHLRDPVRALERVREVCAPRARLLVVDAVDIELSLVHPRRPVAWLDGVGRPWWWKPNRAGLARLVEAAGFEVVRGPSQIFMPAGVGQRLAAARPSLLRTHQWREALVTRWRGDPHAAVLAVAR